MNLIAKALIKKQLKGVPDEQAEMIIAALEKDPAFFQRLAGEMRAAMDSGKSQQQAAQELLAKHGDDLKKLLGA